MEKLKMQTANVVDENIKRIGEMFPNCLTERLDENGRPEVAIDFDQLRQELSKDIVEGPENAISSPGPISATPSAWPTRPPPTRCAPVARRAWTSTTRRTSILRATTCRY